MFQNHNLKPNYHHQNMSPKSTMRKMEKCLKVRSSMEKSRDLEKSATLKVLFILETSLTIRCMEGEHCFMNKINLLMTDSGSKISSMGMVSSTMKILYNKMSHLSLMISIWCKTIGLDMKVDLFLFRAIHQR